MRFKLYPKCKTSGVEWLGNVPEDWIVQKIGNNFAERPCYGVLVPDAAAEEEGVPMLRITDVKKGSIASSGVARISKSLSDEYSRTLIKNGDLILSVVGTIGEVALVQKEHEGSNLSRALARIQLKTSLKAEFALFVIQSSCFSYFVDLTCVGSAQKVLNMADLFSWKIAVPPIQEQSAIAAFLDRETVKIDTLIAKQEVMIELLKEKRQAVISYAVTKGLDPSVPMKASGVEWLGVVPEHWGVCQLRRGIQSIEQGWSPECHNSAASDDQWGVLKAGCINRGVFNEADNKGLPEGIDPNILLEVKAGDVLVSRASGSREFVGATGFVHSCRNKLMISDKLFRIHFTDLISARYFVVLMNSRPLRLQIERAISGADGLANNLPQSALRGFSIPTPPLREQAEIVSYLDKAAATIDALIAKAEQAIALQKEHRTALISAAVTGKIDVRSENNLRRAA